MRRLRLWLALFALLSLIWLTAFISPAAAQEPLPEDDTFTLTLHPGFNLIGWVDAEAPPSALFDQVPEATTIFAWDPLNARFQTARRSGPNFLNDLDQLSPGQGFWVDVDSDSPIQWTRPRGPIAAPLQLRPGNNLLAWTGGDDAGIESALASTGISLQTAATFDPAIQLFRNFAPALPAALNTLTTLHHGDALWVQTCRSTTWDQADATTSSGTLPCASLTGGPRFEFDADLNPASTSIIREALADARTYFLLNHELNVSNFTIRAFATTDALIDEWVLQRGESRTAAEQRWSGFAVAFGSAEGIWINSGGAGWAIATEDQRHHSVAHEFFHVLQFQMGASRGPEWLLEGSARYAEFVVSASVGRDDLHTRRLDERTRAQGTAATLESMETLGGLNAVGFTAGYSNGFLATEMLTGPATLDRLLDFYARTGMAAWPLAFTQAFGQSVEAFYADFESERAISFPPS